jgi:hypothetical protein
MKKKPTRWSTCWKCDKAINSKEDCNYLKCRDGDFNFCPPCYTEFLANSEAFTRPDKCKNNEIRRSWIIAIQDFHEKMEEKATPIAPGWGKLTTSLIHADNEDTYRCETCELMWDWVFDNKKERNGK